MAEKTGGRYVGASGTKDLKAIYAALAEELRRTWQLSYVTSARPGDRIAVEAAGAHAESIVPGARVVSKPAGSKLPDAFYEIGPAAIATIIVSPIAREIASTKLATMPEIAAGTTMRVETCRRVEPSA